MGKRVIKLQHPYPSTRKDKKLMIYIKNPRTKRINTIHFGQRNSKTIHSNKEIKRYRAISENIRNKKGRLTKNDKFSANYWTRKILWGFRR